MAGLVVALGVDHPELVQRGREHRGVQAHVARVGRLPRAAQPHRPGRRRARRRERRHGKRGDGQRQTDGAGHDTWGRRWAHGAAASIWPASEYSVSSAPDPADELHRERQSVGADARRDRDRGLAGDVEDRRERREAPGDVDGDRRRTCRSRPRRRSRSWPASASAARRTRPTAPMIRAVVRARPARIASRRRGGTR